ncbi:hypothetical protein C8R43DRAFT_1237621 [Mycena crocata]|nr:hypothetical protein C8R43DRAFT_1237621 [Mycena crocata]
MAIQSASRQLGLDSDLNFNFIAAAITPMTAIPTLAFCTSTTTTAFAHRPYARRFEPLPTRNNSESLTNLYFNIRPISAFFTPQVPCGERGTLSLALDRLGFDVQHVAHSGAPWPSTSFTNPPPDRKLSTLPNLKAFPALLEWNEGTITHCSPSGQGCLTLPSRCDHRFATSRWTAVAIVDVGFMQGNLSLNSGSTMMNSFQENAAPASIDSRWFKSGVVLYTGSKYCFKSPDVERFGISKQIPEHRTPKLLLQELQAHYILAPTSIKYHVDDEVFTSNLAVYSTQMRASLLQRTSGNSSHRVGSLNLRVLRQFVWVIDHSRLFKSLQVPLIVPVLNMPTLLLTQSSNISYLCVEGCIEDYYPRQRHPFSNSLVGSRQHSGISAYRGDIEYTTYRRSVSEIEFQGKTAGGQRLPRRF